MQSIWKVDGILCASGNLRTTISIVLEIVGLSGQAATGVGTTNGSNESSSGWLINGVLWTAEQINLLLFIPPEPAIVHGPHLVRSAYEKMCVRMNRIVKNFSLALSFNDCRCLKKEPRDGQLFLLFCRLRRGTHVLEKMHRFQLQCFESKMQQKVMLVHKAGEHK